MLLNAFLSFIFDIIINLLNRMTDVTTTSMFVSGTVNATHGMALIAHIMPLTVDGLIVILLAFVAIEVAYWGYKVVYWLIKRIPTQS